MAVLADQPLVPVPEAEHPPDAVVVVEAEDDGPDDVIEAGAQASAGDDPARELRRIEIDLLPRAVHLETRWRLSDPDEVLHLLQRAVVEHLLLVADVADSFQGGGDAAFSQPRHG